MPRLAFLTVLAVLALPAVAAAQWKPIGKTREGSVMYVQLKSVKRGGDTVTARVLTRYAAPVWDTGRKDSLRAVTTLATVNCRLNKVIIRESVYYVDFDRNRVSERRVPKAPGYQAIFGAAYPTIRDSLCAPPRK